MPGIVYTVASGKGGVGKTTTSVNLAVALWREGHAVAVVDGDLGMANLSAVLDLEPDVTLHDVLAGRATVEEAVTEAKDGDLMVLPGARALDGFADADPDALGGVVEDLADRADFVIVDTGAGLSYEDVLPLGFADGVILVTTPDPAAVGDTRKTMELAALLGVPVRGLVVTRTVADTDAEAIAADFGVDLLGTVPEDPAVMASTVAGDPIESHAPDSEAATAYRELAETVVAGAPRPSETPPAEAGDDAVAGAEDGDAVAEPAGPDPAVETGPDAASPSGDDGASDEGTPSVETRGPDEEPATEEGGTGQPPATGAGQSSQSPSASGEASDESTPTTPGSGAAGGTSASGSGGGSPIEDAEPGGGSPEPGDEVTVDEVAGAPEEADDLDDAGELDEDAVPEAAGDSGEPATEPEEKGEPEREAASADGETTPVDEPGADGVEDEGPPASTEAEPIESDVGRADDSAEGDEDAEPGWESGAGTEAEPVDEAEPKEEPWTGTEAESGATAVDDTAEEDVDAGPETAAEPASDADAAEASDADAAEASDADAPESPGTDAAGASGDDAAEGGEAAPERDDEELDDSRGGFLGWLGRLFS